MNEALKFDALFTLSEMAVTMIGVSGLVTIFLSKGELQPADRIRFIAILIIGFMAAFLSYLPYWMSSYVEDVIVVWKYSSIAGAALVFSVILSVLLTRAAEGVRQLRSIYPLPLLIFIASLPWFNIALFLMNVIAWPVPTGSTLYELALMVMIGAITVHFGGLVIYSAPRAGTP